MPTRTTKKCAPGLAAEGASTTPEQDTDDVGGFRLFAVGPRFARELRWFATRSNVPTIDAVFGLLARRAEKSPPTAILAGPAPDRDAPACCYFGAVVRSWLEVAQTLTSNDAFAARCAALCAAYDNGVSLDGHPLPF